MATTSENQLIYDIVKEPKDELYHRLLEYGLQHCILFILVLRRQFPAPGPFGQQVLSDLSPYSSKSEQTDEWPGTKLLGHEAEVRWFEYNSSSAEILKSATSRLYQWEHPHFPEDLCLMRDIRTPWLTTIAHERDAYLNIEPAEIEVIAAEFPQLAAILRRNEGESS